MCDLGDLDAVAALADDLAAADLPLAALVHNAGALPATRTESPQGHELSMALHVLSPVLLTERLRPGLAAHRTRVVMVTSGGMYAQRLRDDDPDYLTGDYSGTTAYARSKRAQVELLPVLQQRWPELAVYAMHPGWADTPGVLESLPTFHTVTGRCCATSTRASTPPCGSRRSSRRRRAARCGTTAGSGRSPSPARPAARPSRSPGRGSGCAGRSTSRPSPAEAQLRCTAPHRAAARATAASRAAPASPSVSVRSGARNRSAKASDFLPSPTWLPV